jgi:7-carboxy-7-deazaguanine synthase
MVFVRLAGCNLLVPCQFCDTAYAQSPEGGTEKTVEEIASEVGKLTRYGGWVSITGGEPLWQLDELEELIKVLKLERGYRVTVETNGSIRPPRWWTLVDSWSADIKCPSSGVCGISHEIWLRARSQDQVKFVAGTEDDLAFVASTLERHFACKPTVLVSPVMPASTEWLQRVWAFCCEKKLRFSLQIHRVVWGDKKGV